MSCLPATILTESLEGVWMGVSHQTIQVTALRPDRTFSGTYFTPAMDIRARFSGRWEWKDGVFTMEYLEADSPPFRVPMKDENRLEAVSPDVMVLHTLPKGASVEWKRVQFAPHGKEPQKANKPPVDPPSLQALRRLSLKDLIDTNPLSAWMHHLVDASKKPLFDDKVVDALQTTIPKKAGYYFAIFQFEGMWGNGGMQHVVLREEIPQTQYLLKLTAEGYEHFGNPKTAALVRELAAQAIPWMEQIIALNKADASEEKFQPVWSAVDAYDARYDKLNEEEPGVYEALLKDIHQKPEDYTTHRP